MAVRHQLVKRAPEELWAVLADRSRYEDWVVGTARTRPEDGNWPEVGATLAYTVRVGPWEVGGHTVVRRSDPPRTRTGGGQRSVGHRPDRLEVRPWGADSWSSSMNIR